MPKLMKKQIDRLTVKFCDGCGPGLHHDGRGLYLVCGAAKDGTGLAKSWVPKAFVLHRATLWVLFRNKCIVALVAVVAVGMWATLFALSIMSTAIRLRQRVGDEI